jgi:small subunit ribosomal protein S16
VDSERAQHWLSVGAQPTDPVRKILEITGDWQKFKGLPGQEGTLRVAEPKADRKVAFAAALQETLEDSGATTRSKPRGKAAEPAARGARADKPAADKPAADKPAAKADKPKAEAEPAKPEPAKAEAEPAKPEPAKAEAEPATAAPAAAEAEPIAAEAEAARAEAAAIDPPADAAADSASSEG